MAKVLTILLKTAAAAALWRTVQCLPMKKENIKSFCAGFCTAEAINKICVSCSWMYSVVFGEWTGFVMLSVTVAGSLSLFSLLSGEKSGALLTAIYLFFSSAENEYSYGNTPIINTAAHTLRTVCSGLGEAKGKETALLIASVLFGGMLSLCETRIPAAFVAISCCALLFNAVRNISSELPCLTGAAAACVLAYF